MARSPDAGLLVIICGTKGSGKDKLMEELHACLHEHIGCDHERIQKVVTYTSRPIRVDSGGNPIEADGGYHHFISHEEFHRMIASDEFFEWVDYERDGANLKGTALSSLLPAIEQDKIVLWRIDPSRAATIAETFREHLAHDKDLAARFIERTVVVYVDAGQEQELKARIKSREGEKGDIDKALAVIQADMEIIRDWLAQDDPLRKVVRNEYGKLEDTIKQVVEIVKEKIAR